MLFPLYRIQPRLRDGRWLFDDPRVGLWDEGLTDGVPELLVRLGYRNQVDVFVDDFFLFFATHWFASSLEITWIRQERDGNTFYADAEGIECWLCPNLYRYYRTAPSSLHLKLAVCRHN